MHLTRKIQLLPDIDDNGERQKALDKLYQWQNITFRAANMITSHLFFQQRLKDFLYLSEGTRHKLADHSKDPDGILSCSGTNSTYRVIAGHFKGQVPSAILTSLNMALVSSFNKEKDQYWKGEKSLRNYKKDIPFPFGPGEIKKLRYDSDKKAFCFTLFNIPFKTYLGKGSQDKHQLLNQVVEGSIKLCTSQLQLKDRRIYWLAVVEIGSEKHDLKEEVIAEASLSVENPLVVRINNVKTTIGTKEEFLYRRLAIQAAQKRAMDAAPFNRGGKGYKRKFSVTEKFKNAEKNYIHHRLHLYSRRLINFCIKHQAGTLILLDQEKKQQYATREPFLLRNWSYYDLITKIKYKAQKAGIEVLID